MKITNVVGARPNFMKIAPIIKAMNCYPDEIEHLLVHTGQHYDQGLARNIGFPVHELRRIRSIIEDNQSTLLEAWHGYFGA